MTTTEINATVSKSLNWRIVIWVGWVGIFHIWGLQVSERGFSWKSYPNSALLQQIQKILTQANFWSELMTVTVSKLDHTVGAVLVTLMIRQGPWQRRTQFFTYHWDQEQLSSADQTLQMLPAGSSRHCQSERWSLAAAAASPTDGVDWLPNSGCTPSSSLQF